ncbi:MAG TPA: hypothetical protein VGI16_16045 [Candidatus Acidoferrum sp.]
MQRRPVGHPEAEIQRRRGLARAAEEEDVAVGVLKLEAAEAVVGILEGIGDGDIAGGEFGGQGVGIGH